MSSTEGHIKLHRTIEEWEWIDNPIMFYAWVRILLMANWENKRWHDEIVERGAFITSISKLAANLNLSIQQTRTCLSRLIDSKQIIMDSTNKRTKIIVCNYDNYQDNSQSRQQADNKQNIPEITSNIQKTGQVFIPPSPETPTPITKEERNISIPRTREEIDDDNVFSTPKKSTRFVKPSIDEVRAYGIEKNLIYLDPEAFWYFYESKGWKVGKEVMKNWRSAASGWNSRSQARGDKPFLKQDQQAKTYPDGTYWKENFESQQEILDLFRFDEGLRKRLLQGQSIRRKDGRWCVC